MKVVVAQIGAREHFLAARALHSRGMLAALVVDWYRPNTSRLGSLARLLPGRVARRALAANAAELPDERVHALNCLGLTMKLRQAVYCGLGRPYSGFLRNDATFARALVRHDLPDHDVFFGYSYASLEMLAAERRRGKVTVLDQIDAGRAHHVWASEEAARWPQYVKRVLPIPETYYQRNQHEWELSDWIVVNSDWTKQALMAQGVAEAKIAIVPLAYELPTAPSRPTRSTSTSSLRVLWLGNVSLTKGIQYLIEAARLLEREAVEINVAGSLLIRRDVLASAPTNIRWLGQVPRSQARELYVDADVFVLPTISDGFAITQLEALAHGVPVIITPNCGQVVEDGQTGILVPPRNPEAVACAIMRFVRNRGLAREMAPRCVEAAKRFSMDTYAQRIAEIVQRQHSRDERRPNE